MHLDKIHWKIFIKRPSSPDPGLFFKVFNTWIPNSPEIFVDVADYKHVEDGPKTLLVGHFADFGLDHTGRRYGLTYRLKRTQPGMTLESTLRLTLEGALRLEESPEFEGKLEFATDELLLVLNSRALWPNNQKSFEAIAPRLAPLVQKLGGRMTRNQDPKSLFSVAIKRKGSSLSQLLQCL